MKICHVGYANTIHTHRWVDWLAERGHETYLASLSPYTAPHPKVDFITTKKKPDNDYSVKMNGSKLLRSFELYRTLKKTIRSKEIDIVHGHYLSDYGFFAGLVDHHPLVNTIWGSDISEADGFIRKKKIKYALKKSDIIHIPEECTKKYIAELGGDVEKTFVQPRGVYTDEFAPAVRSEELREELGLKDCYAVINARSLFPMYNPEVFIKAIPRVIKVIPNVKFIMLSGDKFMPGTGSMMKKLQELGSKLGVENHIIWIGGVDHSEVAKYMASCDVYVDSIKAADKPGGGLGTSTMEAMACGLPLVLAEKPYLLNYADGLANETWFNGLVYEPLNTKDLADKLITILSDKNMRKDMGQNNRDVALDIGDWNKNMKSLEKLYESLLN